MPGDPNPLSLIGVSSNPALRWLIQSDPYLGSNLSLAMSRGSLTGFDANNAPGTGATYGISPGIISISPGTLAAANGLFQNGNYVGGTAGLSTLLTLDFQLNHETWHADVNTYIGNYIGSQDASGNLSQYYSAVTQNGQSITSFNATAIVNNINLEEAQNENGAQINGYNGVESLLNTMATNGIAGVQSGQTPMNYNFGYDAFFGTAPTGGTAGSLNSNFNTSSISGLSGNYLTFNVNPPGSSSSLLSGANQNTISNISIENSYYFSNGENLLGLYNQTDYASYNAAFTLYTLSKTISPGAQLDYDFASSGTSGGVTASGLLNDLASYGQNSFNQSGSLTVNDTSSGPTSGYTYYFNWVPSSSGSTTSAATLTTENADGTPISAEASGLGGVVSQTGVPVTIDQGSSASITGSGDTVSLASGAGATNAVGQTNTFVENASNPDVGSDGVSPVSVNGNASLTATEGVINVGNASGNSNINNVTVSVGPNQDVNLDSSGASVNMGANSTAYVTPGATAQLTCGDESGTLTNNPNGTTALCTINGTTGTLTDAATGSALSLSGQGAANVDGNNNQLQVAAGSTASEVGNNDSATVVTTEYLARWPKTSDPSNAPIFILGMPRSGSTLVETNPRQTSASDLRRRIKRTAGDLEAVWR